MKLKHRPPTKKNPAEQLTNERKELIEQGLINDSESNSRKNDEEDPIQVQDQDNNNTKTDQNKDSNNMLVAPKKNLNFLAELNNKLSKPNLKRKASETDLPDQRDNNEDSDKYTSSQVETGSKRRKIFEAKK